ncbi:class I SAM-dependent methyltransferase [Pseudemcibacter aquimaris]|uniref:class I SAM-dependent methyltransferase n=1 Tax=Pseudemcibacter aquimaris TaxID=2857064 RepID=UPI002012622E|nr:class I SAM-dependent methyltransferase [Pseudemcibacter aquimaris]MCC3859823.1 class I SAM-dependent methyltransferase [Pseudemcibacter aquimaris]WDU57155.1 class I SAM-dependent methyltransferase [Pseudemcibacter aquimaris]
MNDIIKEIEDITFKDYGGKAETFWERTKDHDVTQNYAAFLEPFGDRKGLDILDFGCGPGRDVMYFKSLGHNPIGLDGTLEFCEMAREMTGCTVLHQSFNDLDLQENSLDGVFANASMFHVPSVNLHKVLTDLNKALRDGGILFTSNPRGDEEGWSSPARYGNFMQYDKSEEYLNNAGFEVISHYYRPPNLPREEQKWLAMVSKSVKYK